MLPGLLYQHDGVLGLDLTLGIFGTQTTLSGLDP